MKTYNAPIKNVSFLWNFGEGPGYDNGELGVYRSGIVIPANRNVYFTINFISTILTGGLGTDISIGTNSAPAFFNQYASPGDISAFTEAFSTDTPFNGEEIIITLAVNPILGGKFWCSFTYVDIIV